MRWWIKIGPTLWSCLIGRFIHPAGFLAGRSDETPDAIRTHHFAPFRLGKVAASRDRGPFSFGPVLAIEFRSSANGQSPKAAPTVCSRNSSSDIAGPAMIRASAGACQAREPL
jgi:hypothetical protein